MTKQNNPMIDHLKALAAASSVDADMMQARLSSQDQCDNMIMQLDDLVVDFSRHDITSDQWQNLINLGQTIIPKRDAMLAGEVVNLSENRPALHAHLRNPDQDMAQENLSAMAAMAEEMLSLGVEDVIAIGIGGSYLGPKMVVDALPPFHQGPDIHFVSNIDPSHLDDLLASLNPVTTAVIAISKTFTTIETITNLDAARHWFDKNGVAPAQRIIAVTSQPDMAKAQGISDHLILSMHDGVGGRFSLWSAVGLPIMAAIGPEMFTGLIAGASQMDDHFAMAPLDQNIPILAGVLRLWHRVVKGRSGLAVIPYDQRLHLMPSWLQQLEMESNGKAVKADGTKQNYPTAPIVFGDAGSNAQHSFFQMIHQSDDIIPVDFMAPLMPISMIGEITDQTLSRHQNLVAQMLAQADCLSIGDPSQGFSGGRPSTVMTWEETTPFALGRILACYEHITAVSGWLLDLNSFDQPGVELGKIIAKKYDAYIENGAGGDTIPISSKTILNRYKK